MSALPSPVERHQGSAKRRARLVVVSVGVLILTLTLLVLLLPGRGRSAREVTLADGSVFTLKEVHYKEGHTYQHRVGPEWKQRLAAIVPEFIERKVLRTTGGTLGFGAKGTNLIMMTVLEKPARNSSVRVERLRLSDEEGNIFDASWGASTMQMNQVTVKGWEAPAFPRRSKILTVHFLGRNERMTWTEIARFPIKNPAFSLGENWRPETLPVTRTEGDVSIRLTRLVAGEVADNENAKNPLTPRLTRMTIEFMENGEQVEDYQIQQVAISDSTGNDWRPYLNLLEQRGGSWAKGGEVQFTGALWPGEPAWDIAIEFFQTARFESGSVWALGPLTLPGAGEEVALTNEFTIDGAPVRLVRALAPGMQVTDDWQWIVRYWGNESPVYSVAVHTPAGLSGRRLWVVGAQDERGNSVKLVEQRVWTEERQALFFKIPKGSSSLQMTLAFPELKRAKFRVRPEFAGE